MRHSNFPLFFLVVATLGLLACRDSDIKKSDVEKANVIVADRALQKSLQALAEATPTASKFYPKKIASPDVSPEIMASPVPSVIPSPISELNLAEPLAQQTPAPEIESQEIFEELSQLNTPEETIVDASQNPGFRNPKKSAAVESTNRNVEPSPSPVPTGLQRVSGQTRGYVMLPLMQPNARLSINKQVEILLESEVDSLFIGVLVDGTFSKDYSFLHEVLRRLAVDDRKVLLALYMISGPTMRAWDKTPIQTIFSTIDPTSFRDMILGNRFIMQTFENLLKEAKPTLELNLSLTPGNQNIVFMMLEDNLTANVYRGMREMARPIVGDVAEFMRNPCVGCWRGNDMISFGDRIELHGIETLHALKAGDGYTMDGEGFYIPGEVSKARLSVEDVKYMLDTSQSQGLRYFGLWRGDRQGAQNGTLVHPNQRTYAVPTDAQAKLEIELLRRGLTPLE